MKSRRAGATSSHLGRLFGPTKKSAAGPKGPVALSQSGPLALRLTAEPGGGLAFTALDDALGRIATDGLARVDPSGRP